jgi:hypothetical protein
VLIWQQEVTQGTLLLVLLLVRPLLATDIVINAARCRVRCVSELQRVSCTSAINNNYYYLVKPHNNICYFVKV